MSSKRPRIAIQAVEAPKCHSGSKAAGKWLEVPAREFKHAAFQLTQIDVPSDRPKPSTNRYGDVVCTAAWDVAVSDDQLLEWLETEQALGNSTVLYHGTPDKNLASIAAEGLQPSRSRAFCMFGSGVYLGDINKALSYGKSGHSGINGLHYVLRCHVVLGRVFQAPEGGKFTSAKLRRDGYDSVQGVAGKTMMRIDWAGSRALYQNEWVVYDPRQVYVDRVYEYQARSVDTQNTKTVQGLCQVARNLLDVSSVKSSHWSASFSPHAMTRCNASSYTRVVVQGSKTDHKPVVVCSGCTARLKLVVGSKISVFVPQGYAGEAVMCEVRIVSQHRG